MKDEKRFVVRKYVMAKNAQQAIDKERAQDVDDVWVDEKWLEQKTIKGFQE